MDSEMSGELPYGTEYAKSSRATCVACKSKIEKDAHRISIRVQSIKWDGMQDLWHHYDCFWKKKRPGITEASIRGFESLRWEDQQKLREKIAEFDTPATATVKGEEKAETSKKSTKKGKKRESVEPEPEPPSKKEKVNLLVEYAKSDKGKCAQCKEKVDKDEMRIKYKSKFYHPSCLKQMEVYSDSAEDIQQFNDLEEEDQTQLKELFKVAENAEKPEPPKKARLVDPPERMEILRQQSEILWQTLTSIRGKLTKPQIEQLMRENGTFMPRRCTLEQGLEFIADLIVFGSLPPCESCTRPMLRWCLDSRTYKCCAFISDYTRCPGHNREPVRGNFTVSEDLLESAEFLSEYNEKKLLPDGRQYSLSVINNEIVVPKVDERLQRRRYEEEENRRCIVKNGCIVDPRCEVAEQAHVFIDETTKKPWQALLTSASLQSGRNSFYKIQLLQHDYRQEYFVFRSWGRIGTPGGYKTEHFFEKLGEAKASFELLFLEKSQNEWRDVDNYVKVPGGMDLVEMDVDEKKIDTVDQLDPANSKSALPIQTREIISLFFNVRLMAKELAEFDLDTEKLPLAKLSRNQILRAHSILSELSKVLAKEKPSPTDILDFSNQFYSVMPHASGVNRLPLIDNEEMLKNKVDMLDSLLNLEIAYKMIEKKEGDEEADIDVFDRHYLSLNCKIDLLSMQSPEAKIIQRYVANGHMSTHHFKVNIKSIFKVDRKDETERYQKYKHLHNKQLLWHGSRTSNFAGILSKGLKIAPPEAPTNGYMFGKGVYLADCLSKSAQYCSTPGRNDVFLLLVEAALGAMQLEKHAKHIVQPKDGYNSVKALGGTAPNEKETVKLEDVTVPLGKAQTVQKGGDQLSLLYNEYIVYDEAQCRLKYLIHAEMDY